MRKFEFGCASGALLQSRSATARRDSPRSFTGRVVVAVCFLYSWRYTPDPSLRLNNGCARDDANKDTAGMDYLLKTEPSEYSFADLQRDKSTIWDGVSNPLALKHLREMKPGERLVIYETGDHKRAVGTASVISVDASDPRNR